MEASEHTYSRYLHTVLPTPGFAQIAPLPLLPMSLCVFVRVCVCVCVWVGVCQSPSVSESVNQTVRQRGYACKYVCLPTYAPEHMCMCA